MHATARIRLYRELGASRLWRYGCVALLSTRATREVIVNLREGLMSPHWYDTTGRRETATQLPSRSVLLRIEKQSVSS